MWTICGMVAITQMKDWELMWLVKQNTTTNHHWIVISSLGCPGTILACRPEGTPLSIWSDILSNTGTLLMLRGWRIHTFTWGISRKGMIELLAIIIQIGKMIILRILLLMNNNRRIVKLLQRDVERSCLCAEPELNFLLQELRKELLSFLFRLDKEESKELNNFNCAEVLHLGVSELELINNRFIVRIKHWLKNPSITFISKINFSWVLRIRLLNVWLKD